MLQHMSYAGKNSKGSHRLLPGLLVAGVLLRRIVVKRHMAMAMLLSMHHKGVPIMRNHHVGWLYILTVFVVVFAVSPAWTANLIINGSFETPVISTTPFDCYECVPGSRTTVIGWTTILGGVERFNPQIYGVGAAQDGLLALDLNTDNCALDTQYTGGGIQQTIPTTVGAF